MEGPAFIPSRGGLPTGVTPGTYGDSLNVGRFTVGTDGRLTYATNVLIAAGGSGGGEVFWISPSGVKNGSNVTFELPDTPVAGTERLMLNGVALRRLSSGSPGLNEFTMSGVTATLGSAPVSTDQLWAAYRLTADGAAVYWETPGGTINGVNVTFTLVTAPASATEQPYWNGVALRRVASGAVLGEYSISTNTLTLGVAPQTGDVLWVHYRT